MNDREESIERRVPFKYVYLHGLVRDDQGQKMSKTRGNVVDPISLIDTYGADALRFSLITAAGTGQDQRLREEKIEAGRNFANKLWNAARFVIMQLDGSQRIAPPSLHERASLPVEDRWALSRLDRLVDDVDRLMESFQLNEAGHRMYDFLWGDYCDWYVEMAKVRLREGGPDPRPVLVHVLETGLRLLHPYMPFVTEEIWQRLRPYRLEDVEALIAAPYPRPDVHWRDDGAERQTDTLIDIVRAIRNIRSEKRIEAARQVEAVVVTQDAAAFDESASYIKALARVEPLRLAASASDAPSEGVARAVLSHAEVIVPLEGATDASAERPRIEKEIAETETYIKRLDAKLSNDQFRSKAPPDVVAAEEERRRDARSKLDGLQRALGELKELQ
jgi:valyl-tRNA synthetase